MAQRSNFRRQPEMRTFEGGCPQHSEVKTRSEVEQFDGTMLVRPCKQCQFHGLRVAPQGSEDHSQALANMQSESVNSALVGSGITPRFAESTFATYRVTTPAMVQALETCQAYADNFGEHFQAGRNLLLCGNVGNGKTHLACGIVQHVIRQHRAVAVITTAAEIIRVFKRSMGRDAEYTEGDVINELASFDLLVIDEVGAQAGTHYELSVLHEVIDKRYQLIRPTVLVSNLPAKPRNDAEGKPLPTLEQYIGARALDRLRENKALLVGFSWESARGRV
ncbi:ATP-binding protein [Pseudomonas carnis]|uniref:ATP-binding protein n=1 Tax=Pseudomonas TaxID=286 RepID=UPI0018E86C9C|nr:MULTISPECIES: ATP-binding protein [Pseudomonas]MBJ2225744.1 ATP-binding protein [Pseudomonas sp. MF7451]MBW9236755.1 ATP-binding protein [Pseudomonas carnis]